MTKSKNKLDDFLKLNISNKNKSITHTRIGDKNKKIYGGAYHIEDADEDNFYNLYYQKVFIDHKLEYLTEKQLIDDGPLLIDIDLHYDNKVKTRKYTDEDKYDLIERYLKIIKEVCQINDNVNIEIFILEKQNVNILEDKTKDGIHIIIGLKMHKAIQIIIRDLIINDIEKVWKKFDLKNNIEEVFDEGVTKGHCNWQMYGSRKPGHEAYLISEHYAVEFKNNDWINLIKNKKIFDTKKNFRKLSARYTNFPEVKINSNYEDKFMDIKNSINIKKKKNEENKDEDIIPKMILDSGKFNKITDESMLDDVIANLLDSLETNKYKIKETHQFTLALPSQYYGQGSYYNWIRVGWALANTSPKLFVSWLKMSCRDECRSSLSKNGKFDWDNSVETMYDLWRTFDCSGGEEGLSNKSIMYWCKRDAFLEYKTIKKNTIDYFIDQTVIGVNGEDQSEDEDKKSSGITEHSLAEVLYNLFKDRYVCVSITNKIWYEYINHRWFEIDSGVTLRRKISDDMHQEYLIRIQELVGHLQTMEQTDERFNKMKNKIGKLIAVTHVLKKTSWKQNIMREASDFFHDEEFLNKLDQNAYLLCFNNGVYDFLQKKFRTGQPDDCISKCTKINYIKLTKNHEDIKKEIIIFMEQLFPDKSLYNYMWEHLSSVLIGKLKNQTFNIYTGSGRNGKSCLVDLMSKVLGEYKATIPSTLITQTRPTIGSTSSEIVALKGTRYAVMQEPSKGDKINEGIMKEITGGDPIQGRALFKNVVTFVPQFKLVVTTNVLFDIGSNDDGTWRRIRVCDFKSKFLENPYENETEFPNDQFPFQFPLNRSLDERFDKWAPVLASMLVDLAVKTNGVVKDCDIVMASSKEYREGQDYLAEFAKEKILRCEDGKIQKGELIQTFREWYQSNYGKKIPKAKEIYDYMDKKFGRYKKGGWWGVKIVYDEDELDED